MAGCKAERQEYKPHSRRMDRLGTWNWVPEVLLLMSLLAARVLGFPPAAELVERGPQADFGLVVAILPGAADVEGEIFVHHLHAQARQRRLRPPRPHRAEGFIQGR